MGNIAVQNQTLALVTDEWTRERVQLVKDSYCKGSTDSEFQLFVGTCQKLNLSPEARQIFAVKRWDSSLQREAMTIQVSIDGFRLLAERTGKYAGQEGPYWCGEDGVWKDVWLLDSPPVAVKVGVLRSDWDKPAFAVARYKSYVQTKKDGSPNKMWARMSDVMIAKCAESLALRKAFPNDLSGLYTSDEMGQASNDPQPQKPRQNVKPIDVTPPTQQATQPEMSRNEKMLNVFVELCKAEDLNSDGLRYALEDYCDSRPFSDFGDVEYKKMTALYKAVTSKETTLKIEFENLYKDMADEMVVKK